MKRRNMDISVHRDFHFFPSFRLLCLEKLALKAVRVFFNRLMIYGLLTLMVNVFIHTQYIMPEFVVGYNCGNFFFRAFHQVPRGAAETNHHRR